MPQSPSPEEVSRVFENYFSADMNIWKGFSEKIKVREFDKSEII